MPPTQRLAEMGRFGIGSKVKDIMDTDSKLIPVLREGVAVIKMIFFMELKSHFSEKYPTKDKTFISRLAGAIINEVFGTPQNEEPFVSFVKDNRQCIETELPLIGGALPDLKVPLTDALRVQFLCDSLEGIDGESTLARAKEWGILLMDRDIPFPKNFMNLSRKLGVYYQIISPQNLEDDVQLS